MIALMGNGELAAPAAHTVQLAAAAVQLDALAGNAGAGQQLLLQEQPQQQQPEQPQQQLQQQ